MEKSKEKIKIICTIGPASNKPEILEKLKDRGADFFRINLSHTEENEIEDRIKDLLGYEVPIILDTEGMQVRSGNTTELVLKEGQELKLHNSKINCDQGNIFLNPVGVIPLLKEGDLISIDSNSVLLKVYNQKNLKDGYLECKVLMGGTIGGKKAVQIDSPTFQLSLFSRKDHIAFDLAKKHKIRNFTLSFMDSPKTVLRFKQNYPNTVVYSKIESRKGLDNFIEIAKVSDGILIDRGDLSSEVPLERIPLIQKYVIKKVRDLGKEVFVATNTLEQMSLLHKPSRSEVNDIINTLLDGSTGIALTKETAVGKYPVETVNMLVNLIKQIDFVKHDEEGDIIRDIEKADYLKSEKIPSLLVVPHGGKLIERINSEHPVPEKKIEIDQEALMDMEQIAIGAFSPIEGFMGSKDFHSVADNMRLSSGEIWTLPILLDVDERTSNTLNIGDEVALCHAGESYGVLHIDEIFKIDKEKEAEKIYGTKDTKHPGVKRLVNMKDYLLGGKITLLKKRKSNYKIHELTPKQTRKIFAEKGWSKIVGFHTRNVIHKSHEFIQMKGLRKGKCDGLFVHPIVGKKKTGDFEAEVIIKTYEAMMGGFYPGSIAVLGTFATYSRYGGPREAIFTAIARKNFGCSHFIVGRDHTGVGDFYHPHASHKIFDQFTEEELGIIPIKFDKVFYSSIEEEHIHEPEFMDHPENQKLHISGTEAREMLKAGKQPPEWFMRPEISEIIINMIKKGEEVFVK
jgi:pyruvate kinase